MVVYFMILIVKNFQWKKRLPKAMLPILFITTQVSYLPHFTLNLFIFGLFKLNHFRVTYRYSILQNDCAKNLHLSWMVAPVILLFLLLH